jgi:hypothetical protein
MKTQRPKLTAPPPALGDEEFPRLRNQTLKGLRVRSGVSAGGVKYNHSQSVVS